MRRGVLSFVTMWEYSLNFSVASVSTNVSFNGSIFL
jgi:hypothetical protein